MTTNPLLTADEAARLVPGERLLIVRPGDEALHGDWLPDEDRFIAPQDWVALTGPCPTCDGKRRIPKIIAWRGMTAITDGTEPCRDCRDGRRIVPLYAECQDSRHPTHAVLVGGGSIEVVPVVDHHASPDTCPRANYLEVAAGIGEQIGIAHYVEFTPPGTWDWIQTFTLDPPPVPGRDFGIVIDCVEVA